MPSESLRIARPLAIPLVTLCLTSGLSMAFTELYAAATVES